MTCKEKYMQSMPFSDVDAVVLCSCPHNFFDISRPDDCCFKKSDERCIECWNREITEEVRNDL